MAAKFKLEARLTININTPRNLQQGFSGSSTPLQHVLYDAEEIHIHLMDTPVL